MRCPVFLLFIALSGASFSQSSTLVMKDESRRSVEIVAHSSTALFIRGGQVEYSEIQTAYFIDSLTSKASLYKVMKDAGIEIIFGEYEKSDLPIARKVEIPVRSGVAIDKPSEISFSDFNKVRETGKIVQLIGSVLFGVSYIGQLILNENYEKALDDWVANQTGNPPKAKKIPQIIPAIGLGAWSIGIAIDLGAGKKLRQVK